MEKRVEYDLFYIYHWSFLQDIKIIFHTVFKLKPSKMESFQPDFVPYLNSKIQKPRKIQNEKARILSEIS